MLNTSYTHSYLLHPLPVQIYVTHFLATPIWCIHFLSTSIYIKYFLDTPMYGAATSKPNLHIMHPTFWPHLCFIHFLYKPIEVSCPNHICCIPLSGCTFNITYTSWKYIYVLHFTSWIYTLLSLPGLRHSLLVHAYIGCILFLPAHVASTSCPHQYVILTSLPYLNTLYPMPGHTYIHFLDTPIFIFWTYLYSLTGHTLHLLPLDTYVASTSWPHMMHPLPG